MNCQQFQEVIFETFTESTPTPLSAGAQAHLEACGACREEAERFRRLSVDLKSAPLSDPGELFFAGQLRRIEESVSQAPLSRPASRRWWKPALAAAALLVLFLGYSLFFRGPAMNWRAEWSTALQGLAQEGWLEEEGPDLDDLNERQLDAYAKQIEGHLLAPFAEGSDLEESSDWQDLNRQELDLLIERLQAGLGERHS